MSFPYEDPESDKYPDRIFYQSRWRTPEQIEKRRAVGRRTDARRDPIRNARRIRVFGSRYRLPDTATTEFAVRLREERRNDRAEEV